MFTAGAEKMWEARAHVRAEEVASARAAADRRYITKRRADRLLDQRDRELAADARAVLAFAEELLARLRRRHEAMWLLPSAEDQAELRGAERHLQLLRGLFPNGGAPPTPRVRRAPLRAIARVVGRLAVPRRRHDDGVDSKEAGGLEGRVLTSRDPQPVQAPFDLRRLQPLPAAKHAEMAAMEEALRIQLPVTLRRFYELFLADAAAFSLEQHSRDEGATEQQMQRWRDTAEGDPTATVRIREYRGRTPVSAPIGPAGKGRQTNAV